jgi:hypothetical protein
MFISFAINKDFNLCLNWILFVIIISNDYKTNIRICEDFRNRARLALRSSVYERLPGEFCALARLYGLFAAAANFNAPSPPTLYQNCVTLMR